MQSISEPVTKLIKYYVW